MVFTGTAHASGPGPRRCRWTSCVWSSPHRSNGFTSRLLEDLPDGVSELMCHPGYRDPALLSSPYREEREIELSLLTHPAVQRRVRELSIEPITFGGLKGRPLVLPSRTQGSWATGQLS